MMSAEPEPKLEKKRGFFTKLGGAGAGLLIGPFGVVVYPIMNTFVWSIRAVRRSWKKSEGGFMPFRVGKAFLAGLGGIAYGAVLGAVSGIVSPFVWPFEGWRKGVRVSLREDRDFWNRTISGLGNNFFSPPVTAIDTQSEETAKLRTGSVAPETIAPSESMVEPALRRVSFQEVQISGIKEVVGDRTIPDFRLGNIGNNGNINNIIGDIELLMVDAKKKANQTISLSKNPSSLLDQHISAKDLKSRIDAAYAEITSAVNILYPKSGIELGDLDPNKRVECLNKILDNLKILNVCAEKAQDKCMAGRFSRDHINEKQKEELRNCFSPDKLKKLREDLRLDTQKQRLTMS